MAQLPLELTPEAQPTLAGFLPGANAAVLAAFAQPQGFHYLHGPSGVGKTHLLRALAAGRQALWVTPERSDAMEDAADPDRAAPTPPIVLIDDTHALPPERQHQAFIAYVHAATQHWPVVAAGQWAPADLLTVREDLRSRLAWGQVHALAPLAEADLRAALLAESARRGLTLPAEVLDYVLARAPRAWPWLRRWLLALDARSLAEQRAATIPLAREVLREMEDAAP